MSFTLSTIPLGLLALYLAWRAKWQLLPVVMFMSIFQAASILNLAGNSIGVGISYVVLLAYLAKAVLFRKPNSAPLSGGNKSAKTLITCFTVYAFISAFLFPFVFQGVLISNTKLGQNVPNKWETGHLNQLFYLFLCVGLFFVATSRSSIGELKRSLDWYISGNCLAAIIGLFQLLCLKTGLPFPSEFLHTNPVYGIFEAYDIGAFSRINTTFTEASAAAGSFTPALALLLWRLLDQPTKKDLVSAGLVFTGLFLSISTTGYLCFGFLAVVGTLIYLFRWSKRDHSRAAKLIFGGVLAAGLVAMLAIPSIREQIVDLLDTVIFSKTGTASYEERTRWNFDALQTAADTYWIGAGWGICRASSVVPTLLGNVGIPGFTLFAAFILQMFLPAWRLKRGQLPFRGQAMLAISVVLVGLIVAGPEITGTPMWVFFAAAAISFPRPRFNSVPASMANRVTPQSDTSIVCLQSR